MWQALKFWFLGLLGLLSNQTGNFVPDEEDEKEEGEDEEKDKDEEEQDENADDDSGKDVGKDRSKYIPRDRFDKVNIKAQKLEKLMELGIIAEDENGEIRVNPEALKPKSDEKSTEKTNLRFTKDEATPESWPLLKKINDVFDHHEGLMGNLASLVFELQGAFKAIDEHPEYLQKDGELRKKVMDIMKNDPEFKTTYAKNPKKFYWAVKRAMTVLAGKQPEKPKNPKPSFIVGKGDGAGKGGKKTVDLSKLSEAQLDELERKEHERLSKQHR